MKNDDKLMEFKIFLLLISIVSILVGCTMQNDKTTGVNDDEQPPAPPNDNEVLATTSEEQFPVPSDENKVTGGVVGSETGQPLKLNADGSWQ